MTVAALAMIAGAAVKATAMASWRSSCRRSPVAGGQQQRVVGPGPEDEHGQDERAWPLTVRPPLRASR